MKLKNPPHAAQTAVIYARYSSYRQDERSIEGQLEDCMKYAEQNGLQVVGEYIDRAKSGTEAEHRDEFQRMIKDSGKGVFDTVLVYKLDRFARNRVDSGSYKAKLRVNGVKVVSVTENISDEAEGIILESMLEGLAEYYSRNLAQNVTRGMRVAREHGNFTGGSIPYGYKVENHKLIPNEAESRIVRRVFEEYAKGIPMREIIQKLDEAGYKPRNNKKFTMNSFYYMIRNRKYIGEYELDGVEYPDIYPPLIDRETFDEVQKRIVINRTYKQPSTVQTHYQLQGKVFCGMCGAPMIGECGRGRSGAVYHYYTCSDRKRNHTCKKKNEKKDFLEYYVVEQTVEYILTPERIDYLAEKLRERYEKEFSNRELKNLEKIQKQLEADIEKCVDALIENTGNEKIIPRLQERFEKLSAQKSDVDIDIAKLKILSKKSFTVDQYKTWLKNFSNGDPANQEFRQSIIDTFVNSVYVFDDKIVIYYNIKGGKQVSYIEMCDDLEELETGEVFDSDLQSSTSTSSIRTLTILTDRLFMLRIKRTDG